MPSANLVFRIHFAAAIAALLLAACAPQPPGAQSAYPGPLPPIAGSASGGLDPSWMVCQGGNRRADYFCTLN